MKTDYFNSEYGQGHIMMATGTPVSNSMTELYVMTRYLRPDLLEKAGIAKFDDWAATFGNVTTGLEYTAYNTMKLKTRFSQFANLPELMAFYKEFADIKSAASLDLPRPKLKNGKNTVVNVPATPEQKAYVKELSERAEAINSGKVEPHIDNFLKITSEARLVGLSNNAVKALYERRGENISPEFMTENERNGKVDACVENVYEIWQNTADDKGVQLIFSDVAVNSDDNNFSVYEYIRDELIEKGIPKDEIIFAPKSDSKNREDIFRKINKGEYRVVIANTGTLGTGANIQERLAALHHCDIPWKPSDFEQREGRILRQGNKNSEVEIFNYVTESTLDSYLYSTVTNKARFIAQILDNENPARVSEDMDEKVLTYAEIQAIAAGDDNVRERIETANSLSELHMLKREHSLEISKIRRELEIIPKKIESNEEMLVRLKADMQTADKISDIVITVSDNKVMPDKTNEYLLDKINLALRNNGKSVDVGNIGIFKVTVFAEKSMGLSLMDEDSVKFAIKGEGKYFVDAGTSKNSNNVTRLGNFFDKTLPSRVEKIQNEIMNLHENLSQAKRQVDAPFDREDEIVTLTKKLEQLDEKLSGITESDEVVYDPEDVPMVETHKEKQERERIYKDTDENDFVPVPDESLTVNRGRGR